MNHNSDCFVKAQEKQNVSILTYTAVISAWCVDD